MHRISAWIQPVSARYLIDNRTGKSQEPPVFCERYCLQMPASLCEEMNSFPEEALWDHYQIKFTPVP